MFYVLWDFALTFARSCKNIFGLFLVHVVIHLAVHKTRRIFHPVKVVAISNGLQTYFCNHYTTTVPALSSDTKLEVCCMVDSETIVNSQGAETH